MDQQSILEGISRKLKGHFGTDVKRATRLQLYKAVSLLARDQIMEQWIDTNRRIEEKKSKVVYYLSLEFLMGRFLGANLLALGEYENYKEALASLGVALEELEEVEQDAGLGNGGL